MPAGKLADDEIAARGNHQYNDNHFGRSIH
jgi:hypothetical protein